MIKIEFKDAKEIADYIKFCILNEDAFKAFTHYTSPMHDKMLSAIPYKPTQDPYLDRSFILQQLGISKQQDEEMQQKYK